MDDNGGVGHRVTSMKDRGTKTIRDFGEQHKRYSESSGYYVSLELLGDVLGPLLPVSAFEGKNVVDLGSGTGRWVQVIH